MGGLLGVLAARAKLYGRATACMERTTYLRKHGLGASSLADFDPIAAFCGALAVLPIRLHAGDRFEVEDAPAPGVLSAVVIEAFGADGETTSDLIAWPIDAPQRVLTMFGRAALLGHWQAVNPSTYIFDKPLPLHRTPLEWLQAGCDGAAIAVPHLAARVLLDVPGRIAPRDRTHAMAIDDLFRTVTRDRLVVPKARVAA